MGMNILFLGQFRGGSSICGELLRILARSCGYEHIDIMKQYHDIGVPPELIPDEVIGQITEGENKLFATFRSVPLSLLRLNLAQVRKVLVVRDPRDRLVSGYFAEKNIHTKFEVGKALTEMTVGRDVGSIEKYCLTEASSYRHAAKDIINFCYRNSDTLVYKYEQIYEEPLAFMLDVCSRLDLFPSKEALSEAQVHGSFRTEAEDELQHKRQGKPGDHIRKLSPDIIETVSHVFEEELNYFGYGARIICNYISPVKQNNEIQSQDELDGIYRTYQLLGRENGYRIDEIKRISDRLAEVENIITSLRK